MPHSPNSIHLIHPGNVSTRHLSQLDTFRRNRGKMRALVLVLLVIPCFTGIAAPWINKAYSFGGITLVRYVSHSLIILQLNYTFVTSPILPRHSRHPMHPIFRLR